MKELTTKQQRFVEEFCVDFDATNAAIRSGYSVQSAKSIGSENLSKPYLKDAVKKQLEHLSADAFISREVILNGLLKEAMGKGDNSTATARVSAWDKLAKLSGMFVDTAPQTTVDEFLRSLTERNAESRAIKGMLPKDHIDFDAIPFIDQDGNVVR